MGLEIVEVVMALEDEFDVEIPEDDFAVLYDRPLSATRDYILARWPYGCKPPAIDRCRTQQAFYFLRGWARDRGLEGARGLRPDDAVFGRITPRQWSALARDLTAATGERVIPDAVRNLLRMPVALPTSPATWGEIAGAIADCGQLVPTARPPLGPHPGTEWEQMAPYRMREIVSRELVIPMHRIRWDSRWYRDLGAG